MEMKWKCKEQQIRQTDRRSVTKREVLRCQSKKQVDGRQGKRHVELQFSSAHGRLSAHERALNDSQESRVERQMA